MTQYLSKRDVCALIITYHPDEAFPERYKAIEKQVASVVVIDNNSEPEIIQMLSQLIADKGKLLANRENKGVATALNQGIAWAIDEGYHWLVTFDHDSLVSEDFVQQLIDSHNNYQGSKQISMIGAHIVYSGLSKAYRWTRARQDFPLFFERVKCTGQDLYDVTKVITSGTLMSLDIYQTLKGFRDELFIDYIDTDYCLRSLSAGHTTLVSAKAKLHHKLGDKAKVNYKGLEIYPTFHSPLRLYYISRNRLPMYRAHALKHLHWFFFDFTALIYNLFRVIFFEDRRAEKVQAIVRGSWDGFRGLSGPKL